MIHKLYKGEVELDFNDERHFFSIAGKKVLGVTSCTGIIDKSRPLIFWATNLARDFLLDVINSGGQVTEELIVEACKQHQIKKEQAATAGSKVHSWIEQFVKATVKKDIPKLPSKDDPEVYNGVTAFIKWVDEHNVKFLSSERIVYSKKYNYAGIMDCEAVIGGKTSVVDFKTSNSIYNEYRYQVAAYQAAAEEESGKPYKGDKWIVRFSKDTGEFEAHQFGDQAKDFKTFLATLAIKRREQELSKK